MNFFAVFSSDFKGFGSKVIVYSFFKDMKSCIGGDKISTQKVSHIIGMALGTRKKNPKPLTHL